VSSQLGDVLGQLVARHIEQRDRLEHVTDIGSQRDPDVLNRPAIRSSWTA
jgi:hypothetical protein